MKKKKPDYYTETVVILNELKTTYPSYSLGKHIATALDDYGDIWGISDKEILFAFMKYKAQMEMDVPHEAGQAEIDEIVKDAMNLRSDIDFVNGQDY